MSGRASKVILFHHLGLGDHFICNGLVNETCQQFERVILPCWRHNLLTLESLYRDNGAVTLLPIDHPDDVDNFARECGLDVLRVGFGYLQQTSTIWYEAFYEQLGLDPAMRQTRFRLPARLPGADLVYRQVVQGEPYVVVHSRSSTHDDYPIDIGQGKPEPYRIVHVRPGVSGDLLSWIEVFRRAQEIHVINSSVFWLLDCLPDLEARLYFHDIRLGDPIRPGDRWKHVRYQPQGP